MATFGQAQGVFGFSGPLYVQVAAILRGKIASSEWNSTAPLPNEVALAKTIGVSIGTMRKALEMLESERLIERQQGRGTFVIETSDEETLEHFSKLEVGTRKLRAKPVSRRVDVVSGDPGALGALNLQPGADVIRIETLWRGDAEFAATECLFLPAARFRDLEAEQLPAAQFLFAFYRKRFQIVVARIDEQLSTAGATAEEAESLNIELGTPLLSMTRIARERSGTPVEYSVRRIKLGRAVYAVSTN